MPIRRTHARDQPPDALERVAVVTSTDVPRGLGSRKSSDKAGGHRASSIYHIDHDVPARPASDVILTQNLCDVCAVSYAAVNDVVRAMDPDARVLSLQTRTIDGTVSDGEPDCRHVLAASTSVDPKSIQCG